MNEPFLEPILRKFRLQRILRHIERNDKVLDVGCGWNATAVKHLAGYVGEITGLDKKVSEEIPLPSNAHIKRFNFMEPWDLADSSFDKVTMLAVLEHLSEELAISTLDNIRRVLKPDGKFLITVPTPRSQPVLEFLAYKLKIVNAEEIDDHKIYYDKKILAHRLAQCGFQIKHYKTFQLGMNSFCIASKI